MAKEPTTPPAGDDDQGGGDIAREMGGLPMEHLIGAPFAAAIKAQKLLGMEMINFINLLAYGSEEGTTGATAEQVRSLPMKLERPVTDAEGNVSTNTITVAPPVLGLVPIPALLIDNMDVNFSMEIHSVAASKSTDQADVATKVNAGAKGIFYNASIEVTGKMSTQRENTRSTDKTAKYDVTVHASQQPPTEGMAKLMDLLASTVEPIPAGKKA